MVFKSEYLCILKVYGYGCFPFSRFSFSFYVISKTEVPEALLVDSPLSPTWFPYLPFFHFCKGNTGLGNKFVQIFPNMLRQEIPSEVFSQHNTYLNILNLSMVHLQSCKNLQGGEHKTSSRFPNFKAENCDWLINSQQQIFLALSSSIWHEEKVGCELEWKYKLNESK